MIKSNIMQIVHFISLCYSSEKRLMGIPHPTETTRNQPDMAADATASARAAVLRIFLIERRKQAKMTQAQLAKKLGWDQSTVSMMENGQRRIEMIEFMALS